MCTQVGDYLVGCNAVGNGVGDRLSCDAACDHIGIAYTESSKECKDGYLERRVGVCV